ncbi:MAG: GNAT family N-acetyltransferase [Bacteroidales bacterium]|nr:GNAT family N-acetyltransferase [Bacteroidales bacterium]
MIEFAKLHFRRANIEDALLTYKWAIDPIVRNNSINKELFSFESHLQWFEKKLLDSNSTYLILMERFPLGQIRFDRFRDGWLISFLIDELFRNNGLGKLIVNKGIEYTKEKKFFAYVVEHNIASINIFQKLMFTEISSDIQNTKLFVKNYA